MTKTRQTEMFPDDTTDEECRQRALDQLDGFFERFPLLRSMPHVAEVWAADAVRQHAGSVRLKVLAMVTMADDEGVTGDEALAIIGGKESTVRTRFTELGRLGLIRRTTRHRVNRNGQKEAVWLRS